MIKQQIGSGFKGYGPNCNVINFIHALAEFSCEGLRIWINDDDWLRTTVKRSPDPNVIFPDSGRDASVIELRTNLELFNFSLFVKAYCKVKWNQRLVDSYVLRTFPVITDGELNMKRLHISVNDYLFKQFLDAGILREDVAPVRLPRTPDVILYCIELEGMDLVSSQWANPRVLDLANLLRREQDLIYKREAFELNFPKKYLNKFPQAEAISWSPGVPFYKERFPKTDSKRKTNTFHVATAVVYGIEGYKCDREFALPHIESPALPQLYRGIKEEIERVRARIRCIVFACESTGSNIMGWDKSLGYQAIDFDGARIFRTTYPKNMRK